MSTESSPNIPDGLDRILTAICVVFWLIVIYYAYTQTMSRAKYGVLFLGSMLTIYILQEIIEEVENANWRSIVLLGAAEVVIIITTVYIFLNFQDLYITRVGTAYQYEYVLAGLFILSILYMTWRSFGISFLLIVLGAIAYGYFGPYFPGVLNHGGLSVDRLLQILVLEMEGFYGFLTRLVAAWVALFLLYAGLLQSYGAFNLIFKIASKSTKYIDSGVAQTAVISSAIIGSINGSQTANAGMTGSFTIPLMKQNGIKPQTAGGIEAVASTLGQVLPPVMGAGAFVMASLVSNVGYIDVVSAGLLPATILVISVAIAVHYISINQITNIDDQQAAIKDEFDFEAQTSSEYLVDAVKFGIPLTVLIYTLGIARWTVMTSALYTSIAMMATGIGFPLVGTAYRERSLSALRTTVRNISGDTISGFREGALITAPVAIILASVNGVVDIIMATGVPGVLSLTLIEVSGGVLIITVILAMLICILLGLGMPTTAAYTIVAILIAPTLINQFQTPDLAAHYFVFYAAIISGLTPPVAACAAVAAGIAKASFWSTCFEALKISAPMYVLPFTFIYHSEIVSGAFTVAILLSAFVTLIGAIGIIHALHYQFNRGRLWTSLSRAGFFALGVFVMAYPGDTARMVGAAILVGTLAVGRYTHLELPRADRLFSRE